ncbi:hypothetical protein GQ44DRAFT_776770 [Phaeosphaeriaceae sp. PMI808]|nr:hypothetical protein GQ44DRAFT_776770 [Phaeosphaeriaceae sp. PMI808]
MAEALGLAASVITVVDLFVKVSVLCSVYCTDLKTTRCDARYILNEADKFTATLKDVERLLAGPNGAKIEASQNGRHFVGPTGRSDVRGILLARAATKEFSRALLRDVHQEIVLAKLRTAEGATFDSHTETDNARCHPGTRVDILQQILAWGTSPDGECIFWLNGMAGTGKSTISRTIAQSFADKGILGASFFFKRGEGDRGRTAFFFTTIIAQLVQQLPSLAPHLRAAPSAVVIVVDALDECDALEHIRLVIQLLSQVKRFTSIRLRFFLTSRPELPIRLGFNDISGKYEDLVLHQIPKPVIEHDITAFLQYELSKIQQDYNKSVTSNQQLPPNWPGAEHIQKLVDMAIPLFIFAATVCRFVQDRRLGGPKDQLARILEQITINTQTNTPSERQVESVILDHVPTPKSTPLPTPSGPDSRSRASSEPSPGPLDNNSKGGGAGSPLPPPNNLNEENGDDGAHARGTVEELLHSLRQSISPFKGVEGGDDEAGESHEDELDQVDEVSGRPSVKTS